MAYSVLIVDDERSTRNILQKHIKWTEIGFSEVFIAEDGFQALELVKAHFPTIIISDIKMPHMNGIDLAREVRSIRPDIKFIFLSGFPDKEYLLDAIKLRAVHFIEKPIDLDEITDVIKQQVTGLKPQDQDPRIFFFRGTSDIHKPLNNRQYRLPEELFDTLRHHLLHKDSSAGCALLKHMFYELKHSEGTPINDIRSIYTQLIRVFLDVAKLYNLQPLLDQKNYLLYTVTQSETLHQLESTLAQVASSFFTHTTEQNFDIVQRTHKYLEANYTQTKLSVRQAAHDLGFSYSYLCSAYKKACGKTIVQQLQSMRIEHAKKLLAQRKLKLYEVANASGYCDAKYFSKVFYKETGLTPRQYRERHCYEI